VTNQLVLFHDTDASQQDTRPTEQRLDEFDVRPDGTWIRREPAKFTSACVERRKQDHRRRGTHELTHVISPGVGAWQSRPLRRRDDASQRHPEPSDLFGLRRSHTD
jgi:hypothetical protein